MVGICSDTAVFKNKEVEEEKAWLQLHTHTFLSQFTQEQKLTAGN